MQQGMRMLVKTDTTLSRLADTRKELGREMKELAKAQKQTERMFQAFIKGKRNGRNGR